MSFQLNQGLFGLDLTDYHAILGVAVDAEFTEIRKRYLKIARRLHPDTFKAGSDEEKQLANQLLAKLVSPAYDKFQNEGERKEYNVLLGLTAKRCVSEPAKAKLQTELAQKLLQAPDYESLYKANLAKLVEQQYQNLEQVTDFTGQISELNLAYLIRKESKGAPVASSPAPAKPATAAGTPTAGARPAATQAQKAPPPPPPPKPLSQVQQCYQRAEQWFDGSDFDKAILELKDALKIEPKNSQCHGLLGMIYLKKNQAAMAKVHIKKALELNPQEKVALDAKKLLEKPAQKAQAGKKGAKSEPAGGLFSGLFGGGNQQPAGKNTTQKKAPPKSGNKPENPGGGIFGGLFGGGGKKK